MRSFDELIQTQDPAWPLIQEWLTEAVNSVEVLPRTLEKAKEELVKTQVTIRSFMGAVVYETGGILIDDGWLRILGSGSAKLPRVWEVGI